MSAPKFSIVERRIHSSPAVRGLSAPPPNERDMFFYLLTCDAQTAFPGLYVLKIGEAADDLQWPNDETRKMIDGVVREKLAKYDPKTRVIFLPTKPRKHAGGLTPNHVRGWRNALVEIPDCDLKREAIAAAIVAIREGAADDGKSEADIARLIECFGSQPEALPKPFESPLEGQTRSSACMDQDQDLDQKSERERAPAPTPVPHGGKSKSEKDTDTAAFLAALGDEGRDLLQVSSEQDLAAWVRGKLASVEPAIPAGVSPAPLVRFAVDELRREVTIAPGLPKRKRLEAFERRLMFKIADDRHDGWKFCRSGGTAGALAVKPLQSGQGSGGRPGAPSVGIDVADATQRQREVSAALERRTVDPPRRIGAAASIGDALAAVAPANERESA